jgi:hypothetical protein
VERLRLNTELANLLSQTKTPNDLRLGAILTQGLEGARVVGVSHDCNVVSANIQLIASPRDIWSKEIAAAAVTMRDKLVQDLIDMHKALPETEEGFRAGQKLLARYAKNKSKKQPARTKRGMTRLLTDPAQLLLSPPSPRVSGMDRSFYCLAPQATSQL